MKKIFTNILTKLAMIAVLATAFAGSAWGQVVSGTTYTTGSVSSLPNGWSGDDGGGTSYIKLTASSHYIQTATFSQNGFNSIKLKARKFGGPSDTQALITVSWYSNNTETVLGTIAPTNTSLNDYTISEPTNPTGNTEGYVKIQCKGASSSKGSGVSEVTITYTAASGTTYTVTYDSNGGTGTMTDTKSPYSAGASVTVLDNTFAKEGFFFDKWNTASNGSGTAYDEGDTFNINANTTLYAQWTESSTGGSPAILTVDNLGLTGSYTSNTGKTIGGITYAFTDLMKSTTSIQAKASTGTINNTTAFPGDITSVSITHSGTARATTINGSADGKNWTQVATGNGSITADFTGKGYKYFQITRGSNAAYWEKIEIAYSESSSSLSNSDLAISNASTDLAFDLYNNATAQVITYTTSSTGAITITPASPTSYFSYVHDASAKTITVTPLAETTSAQTVTISQAADDSYYAGTATFTVSVADSDPNKPGSENAPYTVAQARAAIDAGTGVTGVYATGIVSEIVTAYNSQYGNISYNISADGTTSADQLQAYRGKSYNGESFTSADDIKVGDVVVVYGNLIKHESTYEFAANNQLVSLDRPVHPIISASNVTIEHDATSGEIAYTVDNPSTGVTLGATTTADWISDIVVTAEKVTFTTTANEGDADRTATFTLTYTGADNKTVTVTQKHFVIDFATLPFEWAGGTSTNLLKENGVSVYGNGSDYGDNHSPYYVKLDGTGDYIQVKTDGRPGIVTVGVKMIGGASTSKITVQGSADGVTFTDVEELTISGAQNDVLTLETSNDFASTDRYVRLYFTKGSNVGVGPITIAAYVAPSTDPSITVTPDTATPAANDVTGTLDISYANLVINDMTDFAVQFCDAQGNELASGSEPSWITALVAEQDPSIGTGYVLSYDMDANTGAERTAYFKVFALGANDYVYSNLVTITQAAYVIDYATLPFEFDGGKADIATTNGLTMSGLGSDYSSGPKLKFDGSGDWLQLEFNEIPGTLTFDIKGNGSGSDPWGGTFKVQTSTDGESYTDLATYTELSNTVSEKEFDIASSVRFIKWVYIEKVTGNVALGNIKLTAKSAADSYIIEGALNNGQYWASFFCSLAGYTISEGAKAFTMNASNQLYLLGEGNVIPANTAVIIISDTDTITLTKTDNASAEVSGGANILVGSDSDTAASGITTGTPYVLSIVNNALGFYKFTGTIPANKAYYIVNE